MDQHTPSCSGITSCTLLTQLKMPYAMQVVRLFSNMGGLHEEEKENQRTIEVEVRNASRLTTCMPAMRPPRPMPSNTGSSHA